MLQTAREATWSLSARTQCDRTVLRLAKKTLSLEMENSASQHAFKLDHNDLMENLVSIAWDAKAFSDIVVVVKARRFNLHRLILARSPFFRTLFTGKWNDSKKQEVVIRTDDPLVTPVVFSDVIGTLYGRTLTIDEDTVREVFATASYFGMSEISDKCVNFISSQLSPNNVIEYIAFSQRCEYDLSSSILERCEQYLCEHVFRDRAMHAKFHEVQLPMLLRVLKSDYLWIPSEYQRYCFAKEILVRKMSDDDDHSVADSAAEFSDTGPEASDPTPTYYLEDGKDTGLYPVVQFPRPIVDPPHDPSISGELEASNKYSKDYESQVNMRGSTSNARIVEAAVLDVLKSGISYAHIHHDVVLDILKDVATLQNKDISDAFRKGMCQARLLQLLTERTGSGLHVFAGLSMGDDFPPPFRFSVEFKNVHQINDRVHAYSDKHFYGGSFWWWSCARKYQERSGDSYYGLYLYRDNQMKFPRCPYKDPRDKVAIQYEFHCKDISLDARTEIAKSIGHPEVFLRNRLSDYVVGGSLFFTVSLQLVFH